MTVPSPEYVAFARFLAHHLACQARVGRTWTARQALKATLREQREIIITILQNDSLLDLTDPNAWVNLSFVGREKGAGCCEQTDPHSHHLTIQE